MEHLIPVIHKRVNEYLSAHPEIDIRRSAHHDIVISNICRQIGMPDSLQLRLIATVCLLGPATPAPPVETIRQVDDQLKKNITEKQLQRRRLLEFVVAYGAGRRPIEPGARDWDARWDGALRTMAFKLERKVAQTAEQLHRIHNFRLDENKSLIANRLALFLHESARYTKTMGPDQSLLIRPVHGALEINMSLQKSWLVQIPAGATCVMTLHGKGMFFEYAENRVPVEDGSKVVVAAHDETYDIKLSKKYRLKSNQASRFTVDRAGMQLQVWRCSCGTDKCEQRHRLTAWNPSGKFGLWQFLSAAVMGLGPDKHFRPGVFRQSMFYALLNKGGFAVYGPRNEYWQVRLRFGQVLFKQCGCGNLFTGHKCGKCGEQYDPATMKRIRKEAVFVEGDGQYFKRKPFARCKRCENLIEVTDEDIVREALCRHCGLPFVGKKAMHRIILKMRTNITRLKALVKARRHLQNCKCCHGSVSRSNWQCPYCGAFDFGQNQVHVWCYSPELPP
jgi:hypothetical protein